MKYFYTLLFIVMVAFSMPAERTPNVPLNDQIVLAEQFLRWYFPQLDGRNAAIQFHVDSGAGLQPAPGQVNFEVIDWCAQPSEPKPVIALPPVLCSDQDKHYKRPLGGTLRFANRQGRIVLVEGYLHGTIFDAPGPCHWGKPIYWEDFTERLQLNHLSVLMGGQAKVIDIQKPSDGYDWRVEIQAGQRGVRFSEFTLSVDDCGYINGVFSGQ